MPHYLYILSAWHLACIQRIMLLLVRTDVERIQLLQWQLEEFMLIGPSGLALCELVAVCWRRRRICYFRDEVRSRGLGNTIDEHSK